MGVVSMAPSIATRKRALRPNSTAARHANEWPFSDVSSDLTVEIGPASFALHKFPLVSRSGMIRKLVVEARDSKMSRICIPYVPGGPQAFEAAAKVCYGMSTEISLSNVAALRCAAHFLEMTEEYADNNLEARTEGYINDFVLPNISSSISVLHNCEALLPAAAAEEVNLVNRLVAAIANSASKEQLSSGLLKLENRYPRAKEKEEEEEEGWWGKSLSVLSLDLFKRVVSAVKLKGLKQDLITRILIHYAHTALQGPGQGQGQLVVAVKKQQQQRVVVEAMVGLLPTPSRKSSVSMAFLSSLLKTAIATSSFGSCKADLERRIGLQLDQAILEDLLIPAGSHASNNNNDHSPVYDTDTVLRIFSVFLNLDENDDDDDDDTNLRNEMDMVYDFDTPKQSSILKVSKLLDSYLAEVTLDSNLTPSKLIALAELLPDHARIVTDGLYRAVDIFLKVHPNIKDSERYRLCKTIDCQKLSQEACSHAAQNERLPVQMAVQVLYLEQTRLRSAMGGGGGHFPQRSGSGAGSGTISPRDNYASVRRENRELKLEVARMRMRLTDLEKDHVSMKQELVRSHPTNKLFKSFTRKMSRLGSIFRLHTIKQLASKPNSESRFFFQRRRNHSIS